MDDDFGTPAGVGVVFEAVRAANTALDAGDTTRAAALAGAVEELFGVLGFATGTTAGAADPEADDIDGLVAERDAARAARDFATADRIRDELAARGVVIEDSAAGTTWHR
jgi:cysteinyl-tRNA synthetase